MVLISVREDNHSSDKPCDECGWYKYYLELWLGYFLWHLWLFSRMVLFYVGTWFNVQTNQYFCRLTYCHKCSNYLSLVCWMWYYCITLYFEVKSWLSRIEVSHICVTKIFKKDCYHKTGTDFNERQLKWLCTTMNTLQFSPTGAKVGKPHLGMNVRPSHFCRTRTRCLANNGISNVQVTWSVHKDIWYHN